MTATSSAATTVTVTTRAGEPVSHLSHGPAVLGSVTVSEFQAAAAAAARRLSYRDPDTAVHDSILRKPGMTLGLVRGGGTRAGLWLLPQRPRAGRGGGRTRIVSSG